MTIDRPYIKLCDRPVPAWENRLTIDNESFGGSRELKVES